MSHFNFDQMLSEAVELGKSQIYLLSHFILKNHHIIIIDNFIQTQKQKSKINIRGSQNWF